MPVIGHKAIAHNSHRPLFQRFDNNSLERKIILVVEKQWLLAHATVDDMINHSPRSDACCSWHSIRLRQGAAGVKNWTCPRFLFDRHKIDPQRYLTSVLAKIGTTPVEELEQFLPDVWKSEDVAEPKSQ